MPRMRLRDNQRRTIEPSDLGLMDILTLTAGPPRGGEPRGDRLQNLEDFEHAYHELRDVLLTWATRDRQSDPHWAFFSPPGRRPWSWWRFEAKQERDYENYETELDQLRHLGVVTAEEERAHAAEQKYRQRQGLALIR